MTHPRHLLTGDQKDNFRDYLSPPKPMARGGSSSVGGILCSGLCHPP